MASEHKLHAGRRKTITQKFARHAARRAHYARDPNA
ncbi:MAG: MmcB family DNA repair protein [Pseudomonadota bacterium]